MLDPNANSSATGSPFDIPDNATLPQVIKYLQALQEAFASHTHNGVDSAQLIALALQALTSITIAIRKTSYSDVTPGLWVGLVNGVVKLALGSTASNSLLWDGTTLTVSGYALSTSLRYGGDGSDGALALTSGTTTINLGGAAVFVKNYTNVSITGTASLAFTSPHANGTLVIIKYTGTCTITSSANPAVDLSSMGGAGGAAQTTSGGVGVNGVIGSAFGQWTVGTITGGGGGNDSATNKTGGSGGASAIAPGLAATGGTAGVNPTLSPGKNSDPYIKYPCVPGSGGGSGGGVGNGTSGAGGAGGGAIVFEGNILNVTSAFKSNGANGGNSGNNGYGGGGGGGAGYFFFIYNTLTANSATFTTTAGGGGTPGTGGAFGAAGADGGSAFCQNTTWT